MMDCMMGGDCMMGMWGMLVMGLFWVALIVLVGWGIYRLTASRRRGSPHDETPPRETPEETLRRRYAEGEISSEEFDERRRRLGD